MILSILRPLDRPLKKRLVVPFAVWVGLLVGIAPLMAAGAVSESSEPAEVIHATLDEVLARPVYTGVAENPLSQLMQSNPITRWIGDQVRRSIEWLSGFGGTDPAVPSTQLDPGRSSRSGLLLVLFVLLSVVVGYLLATRRDKRQPAGELEASTVALPERELLRLADVAEAGGEFERAIRLRFRAGLNALDRGGLIEATPSTATGMVRREVALDEFDAVANVFEVATYSDYAATAGDATAARRGWEDVFRVLDRSAENDSQEADSP